MSTTTNVNPLKINYFTDKNQYELKKSASDQLFFLPDNTTSDFIVDEDLAGEWKWRKWNSGIAECWRQISITATNYNTWNGGYGYRISWQFPSNFFIEPPIFTYSMSVSGATAVVTGTITPTPSATGTNWIYGWANVSGSRTVTGFIQAKGKWK